MRVRVRGKSYFYFETLPPPLRGPPPSTEGGEGCTVALNVGRGFTPAGLWGSNFALQHLIRLASQYTLSRLRARSRSGKNNTLCCFLRPSRRFATRWRRLFVCSHKLVGVGAYDDPRSWERYFTYERSQRLLRRSPCGARVLHRVASIDY